MQLCWNRAGLCNFWVVRGHILWTTGPSTTSNGWPSPPRGSPALLHCMHSTSAPPGHTCRPPVLWAARLLSLSHVQHKYLSQGVDAGNRSCRSVEELTNPATTAGATLGDAVWKGAIGSWAGASGQPLGQTWSRCIRTWRNVASSWLH